MEQSNSAVKQEQPRKKRETSAVLNDDLAQRKYETMEERALIETTLQGKNREITAIVKDESLRKIWMASFYKKPLTKTSLNKIDLEETMVKIEKIHTRLSMQHRATLLAGLGEILIKKYQITQKDVRALLQNIIDPAEQKEEEEDKDEENGVSKSRKKPAKSKSKQVNVSTYKLLDLTMLMLPPDTRIPPSSMASSGFPSAFSGQNSSDHQLVQRDDKVYSDIERSYHQYEERSGDPQGDHKSGSDSGGFDLRNLPSPNEAVGSVAKRMFGDGGSGDAPMSDPMYDGMDGFDQPPFDDGMAMDQYMNPIFQESRVKIREIELATPEVELDAYQNFVENDPSSEGGRAMVRRPRRLQDLLVIDSEGGEIDVNVPMLSNNTNDTVNTKNEIEESLYDKFKNNRKLRAKKHQQESHSYDSAFYSTDDESGQDRSWVDNIMKQCKNLPLKVKKQLQIIKEEEPEEFPDLDFPAPEDDFMQQEPG